jgi:hypothetical protein
MLKPPLVILMPCLGSASMSTDPYLRGLYHCRVLDAPLASCSIKRLLHIVEKVIGLYFLWITLVIGSVVSKRKVCLSPCIANAPLELELGWKEAPVQICLGDAKNIEVVFGKKGAKEMVLVM